MNEGAESAEEPAMRYAEWRCSSCGHGHPKNHPPCDRCGSMQFERVEVTERDFEDELAVPGFADLLRENWFVALVATAALLVSAVVVLANAGVLVVSDPFGLGYRYGVVEAVEPDDDGVLTAGEFRARVAADHEVRTMRYDGRRLELVYETSAGSDRTYSEEVGRIAGLYAEYVEDGGEARQLRIVATAGDDRVGRLTVEREWATQFAAGELTREEYLSRIASTGGR